MKASSLFWIGACAVRLGWAECLVFAPPPQGSACSVTSSTLIWLNPPAVHQGVTFDPGPYERSLSDPAFSSAVWVSKDLDFDLRASGEFIVEVFLRVPADLRSGWILEGPDGLLDESFKPWTGPDRLRPKSGWRHISLVGVVRGPARFRVRSEAQRYNLIALRWTSRESFERDQVPLWRQRARLWAETPFEPQGEAARVRRREYLEQLGARLALSRSEEIRDEGFLHQIRAAYWAAAEDHEPRDIARTHELFELGLRLFPNHPVLRQMISASCLGINAPASRMPRGQYCESISPEPWSIQLPASPPDAPAWAVSQRELMARAEAITRWWVEHRLQANGELGGGWGDDVEILRQWAPLALGWGSEIAIEGIRRIADGLWKSGLLRDGYDARISDVEHSSEPSTDTIPLRVAVAPEDPEGLDRLRTTASCAFNWITRQPDGRYRFRGAWFNCREFDTKPERALDVHMNTRAMGPALWYAALTRDPRMVQLIARWGESWVEAMRMTAHGKPKGIFPSVVRASDGSYLIGSDRWDKPQAEWDYYQWSGEAQEALTSLLLALHDLTGEQRWLDAAGETFQILGQCGSYAQLCEQIRQAPLAFWEWRRRTGDRRWDSAFGGQLLVDRAALLERLDELARQASGWLGVNWLMYTREVIYTDRVYYRWPPLYRWYLFGGEAPRGDRYPSFAVTWPPAGGTFARLVLEAQPTRLKLLLYNFEPSELSIPVRVWRLRPGLYRWPGGQARVDKLPYTLWLRLPPRRELEIDIVRTTG